VLSGAESLSKSTTLQAFYWKQLHFLTTLERSARQTIPKLVSFYKQELGLDKEEKASLVTAEEDNLLSRLVQT